VARATEGFSGAELEELVINALYEAFAAPERELKTEHLLKSAREIIPLARSRARPARPLSGVHAGSQTASRPAPRFLLLPLPYLDRMDPMLRPDLVRRLAPTDRLQTDFGRERRRVRLALRFAHADMPLVVRRQLKLLSGFRGPLYSAMLSIGVALAAAVRWPMELLG